MPHWCIGSISRRQRDETGSIPVCGSILLYGVKVAQRPLAPLVFVRVEIEQPLQSEGKVLGQFIPVHELGALPRTATSQLAALAQLAECRHGKAEVQGSSP